MMREFTFCIVTFNQENYIGYLLESIKYQIESFGKTMEFDLIISDDVSSDNTVARIREWIDDNYHLFRNVDINVNKTNVGIVENVVNSLKRIETECYKMIAGDDIFLSNNIFEYFENANLILSPTVHFIDSKIIHKEYLTNHEELLFPRNKNIKCYLKRRLKHEMTIETPGVFMKHSLISVSLYQELENYHWIEDVPMWSHILKSDKCQIFVTDIPLVGYRLGSGISTNKQHVRNVEYEKEVEIIQKKYQPQVKNAIIKQLYIFERRLYKYFFSKFSTLYEFERKMLAEEKKAEEHICLMMNRYNKAYKGKEIDEKV